MPEFIDQLGRKISLPDFPKRIISIVPSQTELLFDLGLRDEVIGITKFCNHPDEWFRTKSKVGGTKKLNLEIIRNLKPDLIIGNKEENSREQIEDLMNEFPAWMSDIKNLDDALWMIQEIGKMVDKKETALKIANEIQNKFSALELSKFDIHHSKLSAYLIWRNPLVTVGSNTFINDMMIRCGLKNVFDNLSRYPEITSEELMQAKPKVILLSSEPYPFKEKHVSEFQNVCPNALILIVDGEMFSWYGSRLLKAPEYFPQLIEQIKSRS